MIDYQKEVTRLDAFIPGENSQFWKPKAGQYKVRALTELEEAAPFHKDGEADKPQAKVELLIGEEKFTWTMALGVSPASAYGQLCKLAAGNGSKLKGLDFMIVVTNDKKKNTYTIVKL
jgi:hypothetical protein